LDRCDLEINRVVQDRVAPDLQQIQSGVGYGGGTGGTLYVVCISNYVVGRRWQRHIHKLAWSVGGEGEVGMFIKQRKHARTLSIDNVGAPIEWAVLAKQLLAPQDLGHSSESEEGCQLP
jgi:hypothetical protein